MRFPQPTMMTATGPQETAEAARLHYVDTGPVCGGEHGAAFLLIHGLGASLHHWCAVTPILSRTNRVIALDLPGFGDSPVPQDSFDPYKTAERIARLVRELGLKRCVVVGHSLGGLFALLVAQALEGVDVSVVLVDAHLFTLLAVLRQPGRGIHHLTEAFALASLLIGTLVPARARITRLCAGSKTWRRLFFGLLAADPAHLDPALLREAFAKNNHPVAVLATLRAVRKAGARLLCLDPGEREVILIWGAHDPLLSRLDRSTAAQSLRPTAEIIMSSCGHWPMLECSEEFVWHLRSVER